jgi:hypothetical protein
VKPLADVSPRRMRVLYLNDHLAAAAAWSSLATRLAHWNAGTPLGDAAQALRRDLTDELPLLRMLLRETGGREQRSKQWVARSAERLGRLRPNGAWRGYSPLGRLVDTEAMVAALALRAAMWRSLAIAFGPHHTVGHCVLGDLVSRAERQATELDEHVRHMATALLPAA